jgi:CheY-like chemotaxis protein
MKRTALILDDTPFSRLTLSTFLMVIGFEVDTAEDGLQGLNSLRKKQYDIIFTDLEMPNMNGFEFIKRVKSSHLYKDIPVIVLSTLTDDETTSKVKLLGATSQISKPFNKEKMKYALQTVGINT